VGLAGLAEKLKIRKQFQLTPTFSQHRTTFCHKAGIAIRRARNLLKKVAVKTYADPDT
jgi:hypothetical protein